MRRLAVLATTAALALAVATTGGVPGTLAVFGGTDASGASFATDVLDPPTALLATGGSIATLTWTPTIDGYASGYEVRRSPTAGSGYVTVATVTPATLAMTTDSPASGTWYYVLRSSIGAWRSADSNEASAIISGPLTTTLAGCASNAADTGGDGNGYQTNRARACARDGLVATDTSSGTNVVDACADAGKDRHRFWGFATGIPATVTAIVGITLSLDVGMNNNGGTTRICAELSWDGGATWTAAKNVPLTATAITAYTLGGPADAWGRTWTPAELGTTTFRLRLTDVSTQPNKNFRLDFVGIRVTYQP